MTEESGTAEEIVVEEVAEEQSSLGKRARGPGFRLGVIAGVLAGAAAATLLAPPTGEEPAQPVAGEGGGDMNENDVATARLGNVLQRVRSRVQEASEEAHEAAREAEDTLRARYTELTGDERPG